MTPPSNKPSFSSGTIPSYDNSLLDLQSHIFPYRSPRPLTLPSRPLTPAYLSCWWTRDLTDFWGHFLETTSPRFSEPLSSRCRRDNGKPTTAPMTQWREQFKKKKTVDPLFPLLNPVPLAQPEPPHPPTPCPPPTLLSTHFSNWPAEQTHFPLADQTPFPLGNATEGMLLQLREVGLELTEEELWQWALDILLYLEDWKWLWELVPAPTPLTFLIPPLPHLLWYCCTRFARHGTLFPFPVFTLILRLRANDCCRSVQARLCRKCCGHVIGLGPYLLSMTSSPSALVAVMGFPSFHFRFAPLISTPFAIRRW